MERTGVVRLLLHYGNAPFPQETRLLSFSLSEQHYVVVVADVFEACSMSFPASSMVLAVAIISNLILQFQTNNLKGTCAHARTCPMKN